MNPVDILSEERFDKVLSYLTDSEYSIVTDSLASEHIDPSVVYGRLNTYLELLNTYNDLDINLIIRPEYTLYYYINYKEDLYNLTQNINCIHIRGNAELSKVHKAISTICNNCIGESINLGVHYSDILQEVQEGKGVIWNFDPTLYVYG